MNPTVPAAPDVQARIGRILVYPVKSCAGVELAEAVLTPAGIDLDRSWMVVDAQGDFVSQRQLPRLALVRPQMKVHEIVLRAPGMLALHLAIDSVQAQVSVRVWDDVVSAYDMGDVAAQWFTDFLGLQSSGTPASGGARYRLVRFDPEHRRLSSMQWTGGVESPNQFSDGFALLVLSTASLDQLNQRLAAAGHGAVQVERFRPNIVLEAMQPHDEDRVAVLHVGSAADGIVLKLVKPCTRCSIPNIDPQTAQSDSLVADALQAYRQDPRVGGAVSFGMNAIVLAGADAVLRVGQAVVGDFDFG